jgi:uncharacterized protein YcfJ
MFDQWVEVAYQNQQIKTASREFVDKLKLLPMDELIKAAAGDPTSKLAYVDGPEDKQWIDKYKGTPLFEQAIALEKELLQIDMQENAEHAARRAAEKEESPRTNFYDMRDALKLKQRMLDLELATTQEAATNPEAKEEQGAQLIEQAQAQEAAEGKGNEPHEQAENTAIQQFRQAQQQEAAAEPKTAARVIGHREHVMRFYTDPAYRAECEKTAGSAVNSILPETRSTGRSPAGDHAQGAGAGGYTPEPSETVTGNIQVDKIASAASTLKRYGELVTGSKARKLEGTANKWGRASNLLQGKKNLIGSAVAHAAERHGAAASSERLKSLGTQAATAGGLGAAAAGAHHLSKDSKEKTATPYDDLLRTELSQRHHEQKAKSQEAHPTRTRVLGALGEGARLGIPLGLGSAGAMALLTRNPRLAAEQGLKGLAIGGGLGALTGALRTPGEYDRNMASLYGSALDPEALQQEVDTSRELANYTDTHPTSIRAARGIGLGALGAVGGRLIGKQFGHPDLGTAIGAGGGALLGALPKPSGKSSLEDAAETEKYMRTRGMPVAEKQANVLTEEARSHISKKNFALPKANGGKGGYPIENKAHAENALSRVDTYGTPAEKSKVHSAVAREYPSLAARSSVPDVAKKGKAVLHKAAALTPAKRAELPASDFAIPDKKKYLVNDARHAHLALKIVGRPGAPADERAAVHKAIAEKHPGLVSKHLPAKTAGIGDVLSAGKGLATSAFKSGGLGQVAKSFGNVAGGFAKAHPLATAGLAAGGGLMAGRMMSRPQQPKLAAVNLRGAVEGVRQLPLG